MIRKDQKRPDRPSGSSLWRSESCIKNGELSQKRAGG